MSDYYDTELFVSYNQLNKIKNAMKNGCGVTIRLTVGNINSNKSNISIPLTKSQLNKLQKAMEINKGTQLKISLIQLKKAILK